MRRMTGYAAFATMTVAVLLAAVGCGGDGAPVDPEAALQQRAEAFALAQSGEKWLEVYDFLSPRAKDTCGSGEFAITMGVSMALLRGFMSIDEDESFVLHVSRVSVEDNSGRVWGDLMYRGNPVEFGEEEVTGVAWVFADGEWWNDAEEWQDGCSLGFGEDDAAATTVPEPQSRYALGETFQLNGENLPSLLGEPELEGPIQLTFASVHRLGTLTDSYSGDARPEGVFLVVVIRFDNEANARVQPSSQVTSKLRLVDSRGRGWESIQWRFPDPSELAAAELSLDQPSAWVGPGFSKTTVAVFDVPETAEGLRVTARELGFEVALD